MILQEAYLKACIAVCKIVPGGPGGAFLGMILSENDSPPPSPPNAYRKDGPSGMG